MQRIAILAFLFLTTLAEAQTSYQFNMLRQKDDMQPLSELDNRSPYQKMKFTPILNNGNISFGGSFRTQYELFRNIEFQETDDHNGWYLQRILFHSSVRINPRLRVFVELGASNVTGKEDRAPVDKDQLYFNQAFIEYQTDKFAVKLGRENLELGSRRLVDPREGPNVRRSFDHITLFYRYREMLVRGFAAIPVRPREGVFDNDVFNTDEVLWGLYGSNVFSLQRTRVDAYYLGVHQANNTYDRGTGDETRHSLGIRFSNASETWSFDNEAVLQLGSFGDTPILGWTISFNTFRRIGKYQNLGFKTEVISGDGTENRLGTFNPLYPRGAYFGRVARFGPANLIDIHPYWNTRIGKFFVELDVDIFWRYSRSDAVYDPVMNILLTGELSDARFIGHQYGTIFNYEFNEFLAIELETNLIIIGDFIRETVEYPKNLFHTVFTLEARF